MAKKRRDDDYKPRKGESFQERELARMNHRDLQKACIARGLEFEQVVSYSHLKLSSWFIQNHHFGQDLKLLTHFDDWLETQLSDKMKPVHPALKMGYVGQRNEDGEITKHKRVKGIGLAKPKPVKRERDEQFGIYTGTKKALTYELAKAGKSINDIIEGVKEKFPQAVDKSIKIWAKRALSKSSK